MHGCGGEGASNFPRQSPAVTGAERTPQWAKRSEQWRRGSWGGSREKPAAPGTAKVEQAVPSWGPGTMVPL